MFFSACDKFNNLFGQKPRNSINEKLTQFHMDIASSIQKVTEDIMIKLARSIRKPKASRAVANACGKNPFPIKIPCHRVIRSDGRLGGYSGKGGIKTKRKLLRSEGVFI